MTEAKIQLIYKRFAEFRLRLHMAEMKSKYLPKSIRRKILADRFLEHQTVFKGELTERLSELGKCDRASMPKLVSIKEEYINKLELKSLAINFTEKALK